MSLTSRLFKSTDAPDTGAVDLHAPLEDAFEMFTNKRRQRTMRLLERMDAGEGVSLDVISERLAARENDVPMSELEDKQIKRVYVGLYQFHLEKLESVGWLQYDSETRVLYSTPQTDDAVRFLDVNRSMLEAKE